MVSFIAGQKGEGKTKRLIGLANDNAARTDGHLVFIDDDRRHTREINREIRFVEAGKGILSNYREFIGFILGILSQNSDIKHIYVDGLTNIVKTVDNEALVKLTVRLSKMDEVDYTININCDKESLPEEVKALLV